MNSTLQASDFTFIQGRDLDQIILKVTSSFDIFYYHNVAPFKKMVNPPGAGESLVCSVPRVPKLWPLKVGTEGWWVRRTRVSVDRFITASHLPGEG